jgi:hypothetical protein
MLAIALAATLMAAPPVLPDAIRAAREATRQDTRPINLPCVVRAGLISDCDMRGWDLAMKYRAVWTASANGAAPFFTVRRSQFPDDWAFIWRTATDYKDRDRPY